MKKSLFTIYTVGIIFIFLSCKDPDSSQSTKETFRAEQNKNDFLFHEMLSINQEYLENRLILVNNFGRDPNQCNFFGDKSETLLQKIDELNKSMLKRASAVSAQFYSKLREAINKNDIGLNKHIEGFYLICREKKNKKPNNNTSN